MKSRKLLGAFGCHDFAIQERGEGEIVNAGHELTWTSQQDFDILCLHGLPVSLRTTARQNCRKDF